MAAATECLPQQQQQSKAEENCVPASAAQRLRIIPELTAEKAAFQPQHRLLLNMPQAGDALGTGPTMLVMCAWYGQRKLHLQE